MKKSYKQWGYLAVDVERNGSYNAHIPIITNADYIDSIKGDKTDDIDELDLFDLLDEEEE